MKVYRPDRVLVESSVRHSLITENVLSQLSTEIPIEHIDSTEELLEQAKRANPSIPRAKKSLILARHKGNFFKACPGSRTKQGAQSVCCDYFVINYASNCHMECSYCYLQSYLNFPYLVVYANCDDLLRELQEAFSANPQRSFRVGTGEIADSLALDPLTSYSLVLVEFFAGQKNAILEFKTKSNHIENLLNLNHGRKTVVSWSISPPAVQQRDEHKTATVEERLLAAKLCTQAGYPVAFHFDPLIFYPNWESDYRDLITKIRDQLPDGSISWISMGSLRLTPQLKEIMRERFPKSSLPLGELVPCPDGRLRYFKPIRVMMYRKMVQWLGEHSLAAPVYACMEGPDVWSRVFHKAPSEEELGRSVIRSMT